MSSVICSNLDKSKIISSGNGLKVAAALSDKELTLSQMTDFRLFQIKRGCRQ